MEFLFENTSFWLRTDISKQNTVKYELWRLFGRWSRDGAFQIISTKLQALGFVWNQLCSQWCLLIPLVVLVWNQFIFYNLFSNILNMRKSALLLKK